MTPVSIVIPVFNRAHLIGGAIKTCLAQSHQDFEIIVVDDASSDDLEAALRAFGEDPRLRLIRHETNQGASAARNTGVQAARGTYVAFLDSDDDWTPDKLEKQLEALGQGEPDRGMCLTRVRVEAGQGFTEVRPRQVKRADTPIGDYLFLEGGFIQTSSFLLGRGLALTTPFRTNLKQYEDYAYLIDLEAKGAAFVFLEEPLTIWRDDERPGRLGARDDLRRGEEFLRDVGGALTPKARLAFETTHLGHVRCRQHPLRVLATLVEALRRGAVPPRSLAGVVSRGILGQRRHKALRSTIMKWRAGIRNRSLD